MIDRWRLGAGLALLALVGLPLAWPLASLADMPAPSTWGRLVPLLGNTLALALGTAALAMPLGTALAVLLERTDLPGRGMLRAMLLVPLVLPLPLWLSGWLLLAGSSAPLEIAARLCPWSPGLGPAILFHALAGLPWVALIVSWGLHGSSGLEEEALTVRSPGWVLLRVTLPRAGASLGAAGLWLVVQAAGEITITDLFQVRTFAEEVLTQNVLGELDSLGRAWLASLAWVGLASALAFWMAARAERAIPAGEVDYRPPRVLALGWRRWPALLLAGGFVLALAVVPLLGLCWRMGDARLLLSAWRNDGGTLLCSVALAAAVGLATATLALLAAWLVRGSAWFRSLVLLLAALAWTMPGPVLGMAMKSACKLIGGLDRPGLLSMLFYDGPSYLPAGWVALVRFFPCGLALVWPAVRLVPRALLEAGQLDGLGPWGELRRIIWPNARGAWLLACGAVAVLALGELSATKLVGMAGAETFAEMVFGQLHYGVTADLAARCLLLAGVALAGGWCIPRQRSRH